MLKKASQPNLSVRLAHNDAEIEAAQRLRHQIFVQELGAKSAEEAKLERDSFDAHAAHLCVFDQELEAFDPAHAVVGTCRLLDESAARRAGGFYSQGEFDLAAIEALPGRKLEIGRFCVSAEHRAGLGVAILWQALGDYIVANRIDYLIGTASYHGTSVEDKIQSLSHLHHRYLAPPQMRARVHPENALDFVPISRDAVQTFDAMRSTPTLLKSYLRLGGMIGEGVYVDHDFNTIDLFVILPTNHLKQRMTSA